MTSLPPDLAAAPGDADFELIAESIPQIAWMAAADGSMVYFNHRGPQYTGVAGDACDGWNWLALIHPEDAPRIEQAWRDAVATQMPCTVQYRLRRYDGEYRWQQCHALPVRSASGGVARWVGTVRDIEDQRRLEDSLRAAERHSAEALSLMETLQSSSPVGFGFVDREFRVLHANDALARTIGVTKADLMGQALPEAIPELWPQLGPAYERVLATERAVLNAERSAELPRDPGRVHAWLTSLYPVRVEHDVIGIGIVVVDITERKEIELELKRLSERDPLTGIYNRRQFFAQLNHTLRYAARYGHSGAVLMLDVDNFKWTNDSYGHATGDQQLRSVAAVLSGRLRETDVVARIGGDEFAVILPETTEDQASEIAQQLQSLLCERPIGPPVYVSIGIAVFDGTQQVTADELLVAADVAMYEGKQAGGDKVVVFNRPTAEMMSRVKSLRQALEEDRFVLYAQPIVDLRTNQVAHQELLIRMLSSERQLIPPAEFLPIAERFSLIGELDRWVVGEALVLAQSGPVTVNLSGRSVGDPRILTAVREAIELGLDPHNLVFEITETAVMTDFNRAVSFVSALKELGCDLALDDFGTGFGSFTYLKHLPARYLKVDMEFVRDINDDPTDREIVRSIVGIAHTLGKKTIAEGVESAEALQTLKDLGVDYAQGYHLGRPAPFGQADAPQARAA
jgi:diguanylate cyclase (GGDEF)-like protein/PAS domain S-box-containing protein